jgi:hypothetical protein
MKERKKERNKERKKERKRMNDRLKMRMTFAFLRISVAVSEMVGCRGCSIKSGASVSVSVSASI